MPPIVFLTRRLPEAGMDLLRARVDLRVFPHDRQITRGELLAGVRDADALLCMLADPVDADLLDAAPRLRCVANYAVGYNNIDVPAARARGIVVTNTPGVLTEATADLAMALLLAAARRVVESDAWLRSHTFEGWAPTLFLGPDVHGGTLGLVGAGRIGQALARRCARGFGMRVLYHDTRPDPDFERDLGAVHTDLDTVLREADFISLHVPLTPDTRHLIGARELELMKPTAVLVNTARGPVVDEQALIRALDARRIFAAGLDVFEHEPAVPDALKRLPNVVIVPHIASAGVKSRARMAALAAENVLAVLEGRTPPTPVP